MEVIGIAAAAAVCSIVAGLHLRFWRTIGRASALVQRGLAGLAPSWLRVPLFQSDRFWVAQALVGGMLLTILSVVLWGMLAVRLTGAITAEGAARVSPGSVATGVGAGAVGLALLGLGAHAIVRRLYWATVCPRFLGRRPHAGDDWRPRRTEADEPIPPSWIVGVLLLAVYVIVLGMALLWLGVRQFM